MTIESELLGKAVDYAHSLERDNAVLRQSIGELAQQNARLQRDRARLRAALDGNGHADTHEARPEDGCPQGAAGMEALYNAAGIRRTCG